MILKNAMIYNDDFDLVKADIRTDGEKILSIGDSSLWETTADEKVYDLSGHTIMPGMIDMHIHGCAGCDTGDATPEALETMSAHLVKHGVTSFCPTSMTLSEEQLTKIFANVADCMDKVSGAYIQGINMEGPYISMSKKGAQNASYVRNPDKDEFMRLYNGCGGIISVVDIAPECDGADEFIEAVNPICPVSIAHTSANYDQAMHAFEKGITHCTHLYNAMAGLTHRGPGVVGAVFDNGNVAAELICDGFHIHPAALRIAFKQLGENKTVIISDSMMAAGYKDGEYDLGGQTVYVRDGKALLADGTIAASTSNVHQELKNVIQFGIPVKQAIKSCTINPAREIRVDDKTGSIKEGKLADLVVLDPNYEIKMVVVKGKVAVEN